VLVVMNPLGDYCGLHRGNCARITYRGTTVRRS
jgi:hypothetical protein